MVLFGDAVTMCGPVSLSSPIAVQMSLGIVPVIFTHPVLTLLPPSVSQVSVQLCGMTMPICCVENAFVHYVCVCVCLIAFSTRYVHLISLSIDLLDIWVELRLERVGLLFCFLSLNSNHRDFGMRLFLHSLANRHLSL